MIYGNMTGLPVVGFVFSLIGCVLIGLIAGFFISKKVFQKYLKKNPPVTEAMIRAMYRSMGRTPSEKQVREVMKSVNDANNKK